MRARRFAAAVCSLTLLSACGGVSSPSEDNRTDPFSGTIESGGTTRHDFFSGANGEFEMRLTSINPSSVLYLGVGLGLITGDGGCFADPFYRRPLAVNEPLSGAINKGAYCAYVYDPGRLPQAVNYTLTVSYPK